MAHLSKPAKYDIEDSNIALLGSDLEHRAREHAGDAEPAWASAGAAPGLAIWRIEQFRVARWPAERAGTFYDGDSYIVLHTYKKTPDADVLAYDLHFWLGENTSQDEAGTAAYKTVELDDHLNGLPVQYREVQGHESARFRSYFPRLLSLHGGAASGFHHVTAPPPPALRRLYQISVSAHKGAAGAQTTHLAVRQVAPAAASLGSGDVFVLDLGSTVLQFNTTASSGKERFLAAEFARSLVDSRSGQCELSVYDEGGSGVGVFLSALGADALPPRQAITPPGRRTVSLYRLSDASGSLTFEPVSPPTAHSLSSSDAFLVDASAFGAPAAIYVWIGRGASLAERRLAVQYAQRYLHEKRARDGATASAATCIVRLGEGSESEAFLEALAG
ncbi:fragmin60 [Phellopilus nigrolimitatus]|nr:fragmin60 [Phellopilus nigrolimitatus]